jgi:peptidoglycan/xylan/chitin deacetylase (PgdA/CDA1 family)
MAVSPSRVKAALADCLERTGLLSVSRRVRERLLRRPRLIILCYHRVAEAGALLSPQCVPACLFDAHISYFAQHMQMLTLADVQAYLQGRLQLERDSVVITFDDGYRDNYTHARPILDRHGVKGTFFLTSTPVLDGSPIWIDELAGLLEPLHGRPLSTAAGMPLDAARSIKAFIQAPHADRSSRAKDVFLLLNALPDADRLAVLAALRKLLADAGLTPAPTPPMMTAHEVDDLRCSGHQVGGHTQSHARLSGLGQAALALEIRGGAERLRARFGDVPHFAYPFGKAEDLPHDRAGLFALVDASGFSLAVTTCDAVVRPQDHRFLVPRKVVSPQPLAQLRLKLELMAWAR